MFTPPGQTKREMHRIVTIKRSHGKTLIVTKGDANRVKDPWGRIGLRGKYAYRLTAVIPEAGLAEPNSARRHRAALPGRRGIGLSDQRVEALLQKGRA